MNILIVGGAGFVGCNLARRCLREAGNRVTVVDSLEPRLHTAVEHIQALGTRIAFVQGDMRDERMMSELVKEQDVIFNCAAQTSHPLSIQDPVFDADINCLGNLKLLETLRTHNNKAVIVYLSSSTVIGRASGMADESQSEKPLDIYSANKGVAEKYYRIYNRIHDMKTIALRFANLYGPYGKGRPEFGFINYFIHLAWSGLDITLYGAGQQIRNVMYVEDAVEILYQCAFNAQLVGDVFFAVHDEHLSVLEIATKIVNVFGGRIVTVDWPDSRRRIDVQDARIHSDKLYSLTSWKPKYSFDQGLLRTKEIIELGVRR